MAKRYFFTVIAALCGLIALFFAYFGVQLVYTAFTFTGEGSLGHVGMYIAAGLFPFLALVFAAFTYLAWGVVRRSQASTERGP